MSDLAYAAAPSLLSRLRWALASFPHLIRRALARAFMAAVVRLVGDSGLMAHARRELPAADGDGVFQNLRCGHVFKQPDRFDGQAYDLDGRIFREPNGASYTNRDSMVPITFPYTPKREYVDVPTQVE